MSKNKKNDPINPFDGPGVKVNSEEFKNMVMGVMINKHLDPDDDFDLRSDLTNHYQIILQYNLAR